MCAPRSPWVPSETDNPYRDFRYWYNGIAAPTSPLQVDGTPQSARLLGPNGKPVPRRVHGFGFHAEMVTQE